MSEILLEGDTESTGHREDGELPQDRYDIVGLFLLMGEGRPLTAAELGGATLVLEYEEFEQLGFLDIVLPNGETTTLLPEDYSPGHTLTIFPRDLGN